MNPVLRWLGLYKREVAAFFALDSASGQATDSPAGSDGPVHYLRTTNPLNMENLAAYRFGDAMAAWKEKQRMLPSADRNNLRRGAVVHWKDRNGHQVVEEARQAPGPH